jgi:hypothetical protein
MIQHLGICSRTVFSVRVLRASVLANAAELHQVMTLTKMLVGNIGTYLPTDDHLGNELVLMDYFMI